MNTVSLNKTKASVTTKVVGLLVLAVLAIAFFAFPFTASAGAGGANAKSLFQKAAPAKGDALIVGSVIPAGLIDPNAAGPGTPTAGTPGAKKAKEVGPRLDAKLFQNVPAVGQKGQPVIMKIVPIDLTKTDPKLDDKWAGQWLAIVLRVDDPTTPLDDRLYVRLATLDKSEKTVVDTSGIRFNAIYGDPATPLLGPSTIAGGIWGGQ